MQLRPLLRAHGFMPVEQPPELWDVDAEDTTLVPMLGEMIAAGLTRGNDLGALTLAANNVTVEPDPDADEPVLAPVPGDYVAITIRGAGDWTPEATWRPTSPGSSTLLNPDLDAAAHRAGAVFAYTRQIGDEGSVTVYFPRLRADGLV
jgi:hypothetical protein